MLAGQVDLQPCLYSARRSRIIRAIRFCHHHARIIFIFDLLYLDRF
jgi:hypothetical protein